MNALVDLLHDRIELCEEVRCPRMFKRKGCSALTCPLDWNAAAIKFYLLDANGEARFAGTTRRGKPMKEFKVVSTVKFPGGGVSRQTYEQTGLPPEAEPFLMRQFDEFKHLSEAANKASAGKPDANRECSLEVTVDGQAHPALHAKLTRKEHEKVQKRSQKMGDAALAALHGRK